jgi:polyisoprenoid-binding protein YceI
VELAQPLKEHKERHMKRNLKALAGTLTVAIAFVATAAGDPSIDAAKSTIVATFKQENVPVDAPFRHFNGRVDYDPAQPNASKAAIEVETGSFDMGSTDYNSEVAKKAWLDSGTYPKATFISTSVKPGAAGHFDATGTLTLKGKSQTLTVPVTATKSAANTVFEGTLEISRGYFAIGDAEWKDVVDDKVKIKFRLIE